LTVSRGIHRRHRIQQRRKSHASNLCSSNQISIPFAYRIEKDIGLPEQLALFADRSPAPEGLRYQDNFISPATEQDLIAGISALPLQPFQFGAYEGKRRVASFGFRYDYTLRRLQAAEPIPDWLASLIAQVEAPRYSITFRTMAGKS
jgi:hypothetical protein